MKDSPWFTLLFMFVITAVLTGALSGIYEFTKPMIETNAEIDIKRAHLYAFGIDYPPESTPEDMEAIYMDKIETGEKEGMDIYIEKDDAGQPKAYGFHFAGGALWGEVEGVLVLTSDLKRILGIDFIEQNETPGLGGRIEEPEFKEQFRDVELSHEGSPLAYSSPGREGQVDAITGATSTSDAVLNILNKEIEKIKSSMGGEQE